MRSGRWWVWLVFTFSLVPRLWGIDWQLPDALYYDELKYVSWASASVDGRNLSRTDFRNPSLFRHMLALEYRVADVVTGDDDDQRAQVLRLAIARVTSAILGAGAVTLTALAAARLFSPWLGLVTGLTLGLSLLHVHLSHLALNDVPASFFMAAGLLFGVRALVTPLPREYLLAGFAAGLAAATKYNSGVIVCLPLAGAMILLLSGRARPAAAARLGGLSVVGAVLGLVLGMPEVLWSGPAIVQGMAEQAQMASKPQVGQWDGPLPLLYAQALIHGIGGPTIVMALAGLVWLLQAYRWRALALLACPLVYLAAMLRNELFAARFTLPLLPFVALFAAAGLAWIASWRLPALQRRAAVGVALLAIAVPSGIDAIQLNRVITATDTRVMAQEWVRRGARDVRVAAQTFSLPASWGGHERLRGYSVRRFQSLANPESVTRLACEGTRYVLVASFAEDRQPSRPAVAAPLTGYEQLMQHAQLVETFSPFLDGHLAPGNPDDTAIPFWNLHAYTRPGMLIEVYQLADDGARLCANGLPK